MFRSRQYSDKASDHFLRTQDLLRNAIPQIVIFFRNKAVCFQIIISRIVCIAYAHESDGFIRKDAQACGTLQEFRPDIHFQECKQVSKIQTQHIVPDFTLRIHEIRIRIGQSSVVILPEQIRKARFRKGYVRIIIARIIGVNLRPFFPFQAGAFRHKIGLLPCRSRLISHCRGLAFRKQPDTVSCRPRYGHGFFAHGIGCPRGRRCIYFSCHTQFRSGIADNLFVRTAACRPHQQQDAYIIHQSFHTLFILMDTK